MNHYSLVFNTTTGSRRSLKIKNPVTGLPTSEIESAVSQMIANDIFDTAHGSGLESLNRLELITVGRTQIM
jgi:hypothetical protein